MKSDGGSSEPSGSDRPSRDIVSRSYAFALRIIKLSVFLDEKPGVNRVLMPQILRAGTSVPSNVEEAQAAQSKADFISKMSISLKEARETNLRLRLLSDSGLVGDQQLQALIQESDEIMRILGAIIVSAKRGGAKRP
ncbi:MAG: four helix bundle protein [Proteobacteria bacterium]|nr:four helix bundle protein [Pseudomonadota bacterium]